MKRKKIGVDALISGVPEDNKLDAPATVLSDVESLDLSLSKLLDSLDIISNYITKVVEKKEKGDTEIGCAIAEALASIPFIESGRFKKMFNGTVQDLLMVVYLGNLSRTQVALADKITGLLV